MTDRDDRSQDKGVQAASQDVQSAPTPPDASDPTRRAEDFRTIYDAQFTYVWHVLRRLGVRERDLEDLAHDVFVVVYRNLDRYDRARPIRPWLFGIAFRVASDYRRRASFSREVVASEREFADRAPLQLELLEQKERRELVLEALESLDLDQRAVFVAHEIEGLTIPEIADGLSVSQNTLYSRLRLGRKRFAAAVQRLSLRRGRP